MATGARAGVPVNEAYVPAVATGAKVGLFVM